MLIDAVDEHRPTSGDYRVDRSLPGVARYHRVAPAVYRLLSEVGCDADVLTDLRVDASAQAVTNLRLASDLRWLAAVLQPTGVPWTVFKGPVLAEAWPAALTRQFHDLDVLIPPAAFADTLVGLERAGASLLYRNWPLIAARRYSEVSLRLPHGTTLDLHWDLVWDPARRRRLRFPTSSVLARGRRTRLAGTRVTTLDPADTLLHTAHHATAAGANRLIWLKDLQVCTTTTGLDWSVVADRADDLGLSLVLAVVLARASRVLSGVGVPTSVLDPGEGAWGRLAALVDRRLGVPATNVDARTGYHFYASTRRSDLQSIWTAAHSMHRVRPRESVTKLEQHPDPLTLDRPDRAARHRYLAYVQSHSPS